MSMDDDVEEIFDEEELSEGFDEEILSDDAESLEGDDLEGNDVEGDELAEEDVASDVPEDELLAPAAAEDDDDLDHSADVELALDEVLAETILRTSLPDDDDETPIEVDPLADPTEVILPKQDDEFRCASCRLLKKTSQLANATKSLCRDCV